MYSIQQHAPIVSHLVLKSIFSSHTVKYILAHPFETITTLEGFSWGFGAYFISELLCWVKVKTLGRSFKLFHTILIHPSLCGLCFLWWYEVMLEQEGFSPKLLLQSEKRLLFWWRIGLYWLYALLHLRFWLMWGSDPVAQPWKPIQLSCLFFKKSEGHIRFWGLYHLCRFI